MFPARREPGDLASRSLRPTTYAARSRLATSGAPAADALRDGTGLVERGLEAHDAASPASDLEALGWPGRNGPSPSRKAWLPRLAAAASLTAAVLAVAVVAVRLRADRGGAAEAGGSQLQPGAAPTPAVAGAQAGAGPGGPVSIAWVGDITPGSRYGLPPENGRSLFAQVREQLREPDLMIGNLEGTFSVGGYSKCSEPSPACFAFQAPPENAQALRWAGFDVMNLANNHSWDFGAPGQQETVTALRRARVRFTGRPGEIRVLRRRGVRIALVGFAPYPWAASLNDIAGARALIARADRRADVVIALMHAGAEGADQTRTPVGVEFAFGEDRGDTREFARAAVDAGADLVLGSGPHVIRGVERYRGRLIAYSLGDFASWENFPTAGVFSESAILNVTLRPDGVATRGRWTPIRITGPGIPQPDPTKASTQLATDVSRQDFGSAAALRRDGRLRTRGMPRD